MYPLKFGNIYFQKIWGGRNFAKFRSNLPEGNIGESWDVSCHEHGISEVINGEFKGKKLSELIQNNKIEILGDKIADEYDKFPLLIKLISANDNLSIQVHPDDDYAKRVEGCSGKTEVWYVFQSDKDSRIIAGTDGKCSRKDFERCIKEGTLEKHMNYINIKKGEVYLIKSGLMHGIGSGTVIVEIQQNSDITYRVYDYNRGRKLNIQKALDTVDLNLKCEKSRGLKAEYEGYSKTYYCLCTEFALELYDIWNNTLECSDMERFYIFTCVEGEGKIKYGGGEEQIRIGDSFLIPAYLGEYELSGKLKVLKSYVPDIKRSKQEIFEVVMP